MNVVEFFLESEVNHNKNVTLDLMLSHHHFFFFFNLIWYTCITFQFELFIDFYICVLWKFEPRLTFQGVQNTTWHWKLFLFSLFFFLDKFYSIHLYFFKNSFLNFALLPTIALIEKHKILHLKNALNSISKCLNRLFWKLESLNENGMRDVYVCLIQNCDLLWVWNKRDVVLLN